MRFIVFVIDEVSNSADTDEIERIDSFNDSLRVNGHWVFAAGIGDPSTAHLIDGRGDSDLISADSLFAETSFYSGFWIIEANDQDEAERLAVEGSRACNRRVELRPFL